MPRQLVLPTAEQPQFVEQVSMDGSLFTLTFDWSERENTWSFAIQDEEGNLLSSGGRLVPNLDLLRHIASDNRPGGKLALITFPDDVTPTLDGISGAALLYYTAAEVAGQ